MPHLNNKQNKNTNPIIADRITTSLKLAHQRKNKQTNKNSAQISPYRKFTETTGPNLGGQKPNGRKHSTFFKEDSTFLEAWEKETPNTISLKKNNAKAEKYYVNEGTN